MNDTTFSSSSFLFGDDVENDVMTMMMNATNTTTTSLSPSSSPSFLDDMIAPTGAPTKHGDLIIIEPAYYQYCSIPSALLSASCSLFVLYHATSVSHTRKTFHRLLSTLCFCDVLSSMTLTLEPFVTVKDPLGHWTCNASGFVKILGVTCGSCYNAFLSTYFYLVVCRGWRDEYAAKNFEPYVHVLMVLWISYFGVGIPLDVYNPSGTAGCWPTAYPPGCLGDDCIRGNEWGWTYNASTSVGFVFNLFVLIGTNTAIYCKVRRRVRSNQRFTFPRSVPTGGGGGRRRGGEGDEEEGRDGGSTRSWREFCLRSASFRNNFNSSSFRSTSSRESRRQQQETAARNKARQVAAQSFYYCGGYLAIYFITFTHGIFTGGYQHYDAWWYPMVRVAQEITFPLQGFFNFVVYFRPRYLQWRELFPERRKWQSLRAAISTRKIPILTRSQRLRRQRGGRGGNRDDCQSTGDGDDDSARGDGSTSSSYCDFHQERRGSAFLQLALDSQTSPVNSHRAKILQIVSAVAIEGDILGDDDDDGCIKPDFSNSSNVSSSNDDPTETPPVTATRDETTNSETNTFGKPKRNSVRFQLYDIESDSPQSRSEEDGSS